MRVILILYIVIFSVGAVATTLKAFAYWRADVVNAKKIAALLTVRATVDVISLATILFLWYRDIVSEFWLIMVAFPLVGIYTILFWQFEIKLAAGKFSFPDLTKPR